MIRILLFPLVLLSLLIPEKGFKPAQLKYERVRKAFEERGDLAARMVKEGTTTIFLRGYKESRELELWAAGADGRFSLVKTYPFCALSGVAGPKRREGDGQVPEGLYHIDRFNPFSNFYLSLGINYPNQSDRIRKTGARTGGDIFIHGSCVTIGCIPLTDDGIKELYTVAVEAREHGQERIPVFLFPFRFSENPAAERDEKHREFWAEIEKADAYFEKNRKLPKYSITANGGYLISE